MVIKWLNSKIYYLSVVLSIYHRIFNDLSQSIDLKIQNLPDTKDAVEFSFIWNFLFVAN